MHRIKLITAPKLIEYGFATPQRRTSIIENALAPPTFIVDTKYPDIERATAHFLKSGCVDDTRLFDLDRQYQEREAKTDHQEQRLLNALDAISHVREMKWAIENQVRVDFAADCPDTLEIEGLLIRIKAPLILRCRRSGVKLPYVGVIKPYFGKSFPLELKNSNERGVLFATLLHWYAEEQLNFLGLADPSLCIVGDVFSEKTHSAAPRYKQRRKQLAALCQEIYDRWDPIRLRLEEKTQAKGSDRKARD